MNELEEYLLGAKLGFGIHRHVYVFRPDPTKVIKVATDGGRAANLIEEELYWKAIAYTPLEKWFAPVISVSEGGKYLIQERAEPLPKHQYPKQIPHFFTDVKYENFGYIKGKGLVCVDYGSFNVFRNISARMVKADWLG